MDAGEGAEPLTATAGARRQPSALEATIQRVGPQAALGVLAAVAAAVGVAAAIAPDVAYYPFVWRYYYGPIVADAAGGAVTRGGVTAYSGYNIVNTVTWAMVLGVALWNVVAYLGRRAVELSRPLVYALLPVIAAGGTLRGLVDADWVPEPWAYLFITPNIYVVMFAYTFAALLAGIEIERRVPTGSGLERLRHRHVVAAAGALAFVVTLSGVAWFVTHPPAGAVRWIVLPEIFGYSALLTAALAGIAWAARLQFARDPLYVLVLYGQIVDGMQNYVGITQGYTSKLMGTNILHHWLGDPGLLVGKIVLVVPVLAYLKAKVEPDAETSTNQLMIVIVAFLALGLAMGFHGGVGLLLGV